MSIASHWFQASEGMGDFMGIRYGRVSQGSDEVEWVFVSHCDCDGIGGLVRLLRERGAEIGNLPETKHPCRGVIGPLWRLWRASRKEPECANRRDWQLTGPAEMGVGTAVAWHLFTEEETQAIRERCQREQVTVNSLLLKHLDQAVRPEIRRPQAKIPWMIPVNLRGDIHHADATENHVSCVDVRIAADDSVGAVQEQVRQRLERGEHRANALLLELGRLLSHGAKVKFLEKDRGKPAGNIGAFSNLGVWDSEKKIDTHDSWLFCPPVVKGQLLGAGCVTFQNRLGLAVQGHPNLSGAGGLTSIWIKRWVGGMANGEC
jgi:hypothetical protein